MMMMMIILTTTTKNLVYFELTMTWVPNGFISSRDGALRPAIIKVRVRYFRSEVQIFQVLFQPLRLFILLQKLGSLSYLYLQILFVSCISIHDNDDDKLSAVKADAFVRSFLPSLATNQQEKETTAYSDNDLTCVCSFLQRLPYLVRA